MDGSEIPPFFVCPISLQVMEDPVTLCTGVSYDRESISRWLSAYRQSTCPVTNQPIADKTLTPNTTLLRLIHSWAAANCRRRLGNPRSGRRAEEAGGAAQCHEEDQGAGAGKWRVQDFMEETGVTSLVSQLVTKPPPPEGCGSLLNNAVAISDEATSLLYLMSPPAAILKKLSEIRNGELIRSLSSILQRGSYQARVHSILLLRTIFMAVDGSFKADLQADLFDGTVEILKDQNCDRAASVAALSVLAEVAPHGRNRVKAVESGAVAVLVELLAEEKGEGRKCEAMLALLEQLSRRAEGRAALVSHAAGVAAVAGKLLSGSAAAAGKAVRILLLLCRSCGGRALVEEMAAVGATEKLVALARQPEGNSKTREKAKEILAINLDSWRRSPASLQTSSPEIIRLHISIVLSRHSVYSQNDRVVNFLLSNKAVDLNFQKISINRYSFFVKINNSTLNRC
ncbi:unnamed protein product [Spirodela intermedia]|uniref:U-box domain-containing protein n=1 Tax=Spirodela intermedia TaxID=51605 RepID=A0A7I8JTZ6_SPIIN|nr:unnamed protein product [Spirodela intermedia]CAA6673648.1 unnamed protein product [Spirodela intermedia]